MPEHERIDHGRTCASASRQDDMATNMHPPYIVASHWWNKRFRHELHVLHMPDDVSTVLRLLQPSSASPTTKLALVGTSPRLLTHGAEHVQTTVPSQWQRDAADAAMGTSPSPAPAPTRSSARTQHAFIVTCTNGLQEPWHIACTWS
jgi:hypothetical protein